MRQPPRHIEIALSDYDQRLGIQWDDQKHGWQLTYKGNPQGFILLHRHDGTPIMDLYVDELLDIVAMCDMHQHFDALEKNRKALAQRKYEHNRAAQRFVDQDLRSEMIKLADFSVERGRTPKPFGEIHNNPLAKGA